MHPNRRVVVDLSTDPASVNIRRGPYASHPTRPGRTYHPSGVRLKWFIKQYALNRKKISWFTVVPNA